MRRPILLLVACALSSFACSKDDAASPPSVVDSGAKDSSVVDASTCPACVTDKDCVGFVCAQFGGDSFCAQACAKAEDCAADRACTIVTSVTGAQASVCVPRGEVCGPTIGPSSDGGVEGGGGTCGTFTPPDTPSSCKSCSSDGGTRCQANGCYGGWWCDTATSRCHAPQAGCDDAGAFDGGATDAAPFDGGPAITGSVTASGGTESRLFFAVVGDTRPASIDDTPGYPTAIITQIYGRLSTLSPMPPFAVSTGDYMFASVGRSEASPQLDLYLGARKVYPGVLFPTMGNHECTGATASNCGDGAKDGVTANYTSYVEKMLAPIGQTNPWYVVHVGAVDKSWTAKLVFVAGNAWNDAQAAFLESALSEATTYTFIVRHEPSNTFAAPGVAPSEAIIAKHPLTLELVGHTHTYGRRGAREVIIGNGGAPLTGTGNYGFAIVGQRDDGAVQVDMIDYGSGAADASFHFAVKADGSPAP